MRHERQGSTKGVLTDGIPYTLYGRFSVATPRVGGYAPGFSNALGSALSGLALSSLGRASFIAAATWIAVVRTSRLQTADVLGLYVRYRHRPTVAGGKEELKPCFPFPISNFLRPFHFSA